MAEVTKKDEVFPYESSKEKHETVIGVKRYMFTRKLDVETKAPKFLEISNLHVDSFGGKPKNWWLPYDHIPDLVVNMCKYDDSLKKKIQDKVNKI